MYHHVTVFDEISKSAPKTVFMCEQKPAQKLSSIAWTPISYVTLPITVFFLCVNMLDLNCQKQTDKFAIKMKGTGTNIEL